MAETGQSWQRTFKALPEQARVVRRWVGARITHEDAPLVAHELFIALLATEPADVEMTLSTAGARVRITATGPIELPLRITHGPGHPIIAGLSVSSGITPDALGLWAQLTKE